MDPLLMAQVGQLLDDLKAAIDGIPVGIMARTWYGPPAMYLTPNISDNPHPLKSFHIMPIVELTCPSLPNRNASFKPRADQSLPRRGFLLFVATSMD
jgi:hypothetical protein